MNNSIDFELGNKNPSIRVFEITNDCYSRHTIVERLGDDDYYVHECNEDKWRGCCNCWYYMKCDKKVPNKIGLIAKLLDDYKKFKIKFLMELKNHEGNENK